MAGLRHWVLSLFSFGAGGESVDFSWHAGFAVLQLAPPLAQSAWFFAFGLVRSNVRPHSVGSSFARSKPECPDNSGRLQFHGVPNLSLNSDPACIAFRSLSTSSYLGSAHRLGAGGSG
jgi:hypothetical protein